MTLIDSTNTPPKNSGLTLKSKFWGVHWFNTYGIDHNDISRTIELPKSTVHNIFKRVKETGSSLPRKTPGAPKKINERSQRALVRAVRSNPKLNYNDLKVELSNTDVNVCRATVISSLKDMGYKSYFAAHKPRLTQKHKEKKTSLGSKSRQLDE